jgi:hypothetical protein
MRREMKWARSEYNVFTSVLNMGTSFSIPISKHGSLCYNICLLFLIRVCVQGHETSVFITGNFMTS